MAVSTDRINGARSALGIKAPVRVAAGSNIDLTGLQTIDGVVLESLDRVLVWAQDVGAENGIYEARSGEWVRAVDCNGNGDIANGTAVRVAGGASGGDVVYVQYADNVVVGTTAMDWQEVESAGSDTIGDIILDPDVAIGDFIQTHGYLNIGDGGGGYYQIVAGGTGTADGGSFIDLTASGLQAMLLFGPAITAEQFGVVLDDNGNAQERSGEFNAAFSFASAQRPDVFETGDDTKGVNFTCGTDFFAKDVLYLQDGSTQARNIDIDWSGHVMAVTGGELAAHTDLLPIPIVHFRLKNCDVSWPRFECEQICAGIKAKSDIGSQHRNLILFGFRRYGLWKTAGNDSTWYDPLIKQWYRVAGYTRNGRLVSDWENWDGDCIVVTTKDHRFYGGQIGWSGSCVRLLDTTPNDPADNVMGENAYWCGITGTGFDGDNGSGDVIFDSLHVMQGVGSQFPGNPRNESMGTGGPTGILSYCRVANLTYFKGLDNDYCIHKMYGAQVRITEETVGSETTSNTASTEETMYYHPRVRYYADGKSRYPFMASYGTGRSNSMAFIDDVGTVMTAGATLATQSSYALHKSAVQAAQATIPQLKYISSVPLVEDASPGHFDGAGLVTMGERHADAMMSRARAIPGRDPIVILAMGQSNMRGHVTATNGDHTIESGVYAWNGNMFTSPGTAFAPAEYGVIPFNVGSDPWANNMAVNAANDIKTATGRDVYIIMKAKGARTIDSFILPATNTANGWTNADEDLTIYMYPDIANAIAAVPGRVRSYADFFMWQQGEASTRVGTVPPDDTVDLYRDKLIGLVGDLETAGLYKTVPTWSGDFDEWNYLNRADTGTYRGEVQFVGFWDASGDTLPPIYSRTPGDFWVISVSSSAGGVGGETLADGEILYCLVAEPSSTWSADWSHVVANDIPTKVQGVRNSVSVREAEFVMYPGRDETPYGGIQRTEFSPSASIGHRFHTNSEYYDWVFDGANWQANGADTHIFNGVGSGDIITVSTGAVGAEVNRLGLFNNITFKTAGLKAYDEAGAEVLLRKLSYHRDDTVATEADWFIGGEFDQHNVVARELDFATRAEAVTWIAAHVNRRDGVVFAAAGFLYEFKAGASDITDLSGVIPFGHVYPDHFGENITPGTTNMKGKIDQAIAYTSDIHFGSGVYLVSTSIDITATCHFDGGSSLFAGTAAAVTLSGDIRAGESTQLFDWTGSGSFVITGMDHVYADWFGAGPSETGAANQTAVQAAVDNLDSGEIRFGAGTYDIDGIVTITDSFKGIVGAREGVTILRKRDLAADLLHFARAVPASNRLLNPFVRGIKFSSVTTDDHSAGAYIKMEACVYSRIHDVETTDGFDGIIMIASDQHDLSSVHIEHPDRSAGGQQDSNVGLGFYDPGATYSHRSNSGFCRGVKVRNHQSSGTSRFAKNMVINSADGLWFDGCYSGNALVNDLYIAPGAADSQLTGIKFSNTWFDPIRPTSGANATVEITGATSAAMGLMAFQSCYLMGGTVAETAFYLHPTGTTLLDGVSITGCQIHNYLGRAVNVASDGSGLVQGLNLGGGNIMKNCQIDGASAESFVEIDDAESFVIDGNIISWAGAIGQAMTTSAGDYAITLGANCDDFSVTSNIVLGHAVGGILDNSGSTASIVANNSGHAPNSGTNVVPYYSEGTWVPVPADAASGGNTGTSGTALGNYIRDGNKVVVEFQLLDVVTTSLTAGNVFYVQGLPFTTGALPFLPSVGTLSANQLTFTGTLALYANQGADAFSIRDTRSGANAADLLVSGLASGTAKIRGEITYFV